MSNMAGKDRKEIEEIARKILKDNNMYKIPVDPVILANKMGVNVANAEFVDPTISGMITVDNETAQIWVNVFDPHPRKIFTVAHELGHKVLHLGNGGRYIDFQINMFRGNPDVNSEEHRKEVEANWFAAALLMDELFVRELWPKTLSVYRMAEIFTKRGKRIPLFFASV